MINDYKDLLVWQEAMNLVEVVYRLTARFPKDELYGLTNQIRRAVVSIPSNIAEGYNRKSKKEYINFLYIAKGSSAETETQLLVSERLGFTSAIDIQDALNVNKGLAKMLTSLINKLENI